mgnify:CR=1 FL=1
MKGHAFTAYLRIYQPLAAFPPRERVEWAAYVEAGQVLPASLLVLAWYGAARSAAALRVFQGMMLLFIVSGVVGTLLGVLGGVTLALNVDVVVPAIEQAFPWGDMTLMVQSENDPARLLYRRLGYVDESVATNYYGPGRAGIRMRKPRPRDRW